MDIILNLEKKYCEFTKYINMCNHIVKSYSKLDFGLLIENNIEIYSKLFSYRLKFRFFPLYSYF